MTSSLVRILLLTSIALIMISSSTIFSVDYSNWKEFQFLSISSSVCGSKMHSLTHEKNFFFYFERIINQNHIGHFQHDHDQEREIFGHKNVNEDKRRRRRRRRRRHTKIFFFGFFDKRDVRRSVFAVCEFYLRSPLSLTKFTSLGNLCQCQNLNFHSSPFDFDFEKEN